MENILHNLAAEKSSTVGDSAYSYSCSNNSKSTQSSKSKSESNSSGSSGYRGKRDDADYIENNASPILDKRVNAEPKAAEKSLTTNEIADSHDAQTHDFNATSQATNKNVKDGNTNAQLAPPTPGTLGDLGNETDSFDISITRRPKDMVFCIKKKDNFQTTMCDTQKASVLCTIDYPITHCSDGFFCVISMIDGIVMYTTLSISSALGFPRDMWIGRSFIDFIHPNDRDAFVSQVANESKHRNNCNGSKADSGTSIFCRIRRHKILTSGFGIKDRSSEYRPFHLKFFFKNILNEDVIYLIVQAMSFTSAYKMSREIFTTPVPFELKHSVTGSLKYVDRESISYLGYLPQDIMDKDIFEFYHPSDLAYLMNVYQAIVKQGSYKSCKPYRILAQNGNYIKLETEWKSHVNPLTRKLDYITGKHYVVEGPTNPNVFEKPQKDDPDVLTTEEKEKILELTKGIKKLLGDVLTKPTKQAKQQMNKRCQEISAFMDSFLETNAGGSTGLKDTKYKGNSVKLASSLHNCSDSKSSTETTLSYDRLNYDETLQRYFDSHESCILNEYGDFNSMRGIEEGLGSIPDALRPTSPSELTASADASSSADPSAGLNQTVWLTESLLNKHNETMEKKLVKIHHQNKAISKAEKGKLKVSKQKISEHLERCNESYQPTPALHTAHPNVLKRTQEHMPCPIPHKVNCTAVRDKPPMGILPVYPLSTIAPGVPMYYTTPMQPTVPVLDNYAANPFGSKVYGAPLTGPYMMYNHPYCTVPYTYTPPNQLPYSLEQSCIKSYINVPVTSTCSNSTDTNRFNDKKAKTSNSDETDEDLSFSSLYSSFFKTDSKSAEDTDPKNETKDDGKFWHRRLLVDDVSSTTSCKPIRSQDIAKRRMDPPWMDRVSVTSDLIYKYQIHTKNIEEVLEADRKALEKLHQPALVNEQLEQLYLDLQLQGVAEKLTLEEGNTSSGSSSEETSPKPSTSRNGSAKRKRRHDVMVFLFEENAPLPPPEDTAATPVT